MDKLKQPSEEAMNNLYMFLGRILPKYTKEINLIIEQREQKERTGDAIRNKDMPAD